MTNSIDSDSTLKKQGNQPLLPFAGGDLDRSGIRLTRAEFSRFLGVSKQAVTDWVKSGKVVIGADGRLDPRQAVSQLLRSGDPARLRSKVLAPLVKDVGALQRRIADLERDLARALEDVEFNQGSSYELIHILQAFEKCLLLEWEALRALDVDTALAAITTWLRYMEIHVLNPAPEILARNEPDDAWLADLDSEIAAEIEAAAAEHTGLAASEKMEGGAGFGGNTDDAHLDGLTRPPAESMEYQPAARLSADDGGRGEPR